jgi:hypothetical protein
MAASVATYSEDLLVRDWLRRDTRLPRTGPIDTRNGLRSSIKALVGYWERVTLTNDANIHANDGAIGPRSSERSPKHERELFKPVRQPDAHVPPPSYDECVADLPPDYTDALATVRLYQAAAYSPEKTWKHDDTEKRSQDVDLSSTEGFRNHGKKAAKKAAKQAQKDKWADSGDEGEKAPEGDGDGSNGGAGDGSGGGDDGAGAGGDGGDPPGGGGGDDGGEDPWDFGGKKGKKKKKKNAWELYEEEEKQKEADEAKKAEDEAAAGAGAAEPDPVDDWGSFAPVGKGKKGKKGKAEPEPVAEPVMDTVDLGASATAETPAEANMDDEWVSL